MIGSRATVIRGDARALPLKDESVDAVATDEPYGMSDGSKLKKLRQPDGSYNLETFDAGSWDRGRVRDWMPEAFRVTKPGGSLLCFTDRRLITEAIADAEAAGWRFRDTFYWMKTNPAPSFRHSFRSSIEAGFYATKTGGKRWWPDDQRMNVFQCPTTRTAGLQIHPTQKHIAVMRWLVVAACPPDGWLLDCYAGSGTTAIAALAEGRRCILVEREENYCIAARNRLLGGTVNADRTCTVDQPRLPGMTT